MKELDLLLEVAERRDRPADLIWPAAAAAIELLWWHDRSADALHLAETTIRDLAANPGRLFAQRIPFREALMVGALVNGLDPVERLSALSEVVPADTVMGKSLRWTVENYGRPYDAFELSGGSEWSRESKPLKRIEQALSERDLTQLDEAERYRLWGGTHHCRQYGVARRLLDETGEYPPIWYVATWMAGHMVEDGEVDLASALILNAFPDWHPYEVWDVAPTGPVVQPRLRPAVTPEIREAVLGRVDISRIPGVA
ncbi:hypothetical protein ABT337_26775 [Saccharopolyspora hirsuta]|uniref:Uncharacterized protein n=1 Tax=Saccharopolyspora hirsuta TaxID=1837 RepID=A0A5M7BKR7_SACHI|nr:hypothetical protein [Saccharopolyspora hirsuta]KAA5830686.1 hypothetical protein F1721_22855 [Saccharopolyspora hirsuta]